MEKQGVVKIGHTPSIKSGKPCETLENDEPLTNDEVNKDNLSLEKVAKEIEIE